MLASRALTSVASASSFSGVLGTANGGTGLTAFAAGTNYIVPGLVMVWHNGTVVYSGSSFTAAITASSANDKILIGAGSYDITAANTQTLKSGVTLIGDNPTTTIITSSLAGIMLQGSGNNTLINLTVTSTAPTTGPGAGGNPIVWDLANNKAINCILNGNSDSCTTTTACTDYWLLSCTVSGGFDVCDCGANAVCNATIDACHIIATGFSASVSVIGNYGSGVFTVRNCDITLTNNSGGGAGAMNIFNGPCNVSGCIVSAPSGAVNFNTSNGVNPINIDGGTQFNPAMGAATTANPQLFGTIPTAKFITGIAAPNSIVSTATTLTLTANTTYYFRGSSNTVWTLPPRSGNGDAPIWVKNYGTAIITVTAAGSDNIYQTASVTSFPVYPGGWCELRASQGSAGNSYWCVAGSMILDSKDTQSSYASGTAYTLTATPAASTFGTTSPSIVLDRIGRWKVYSKVNVQNNGATFASSRTVTGQLQDTTNSVSLTNGSDVFITGAITGVTSEAGDLYMEAEYTLSAQPATIVPFTSVSVVPTAGSIQAVAPGTWIKAQFLGPQ